MRLHAIFACYCSSIDRSQLGVTNARVDDHDCGGCTLQLVLAIPEADGQARNLNSHAQNSWHSVGAMQTAGSPVLITTHYNAFIRDASASTRPRATSFTLSTSPEDLSNTPSAPQRPEAVHTIDHTIPFRVEFPRLAHPVPNQDPCSVVQYTNAPRCSIEPKQARISSLPLPDDREYTYSGVGVRKELDDFG